MEPVVVFRTKPTVDEKVPPLVPVLVTTAVLPLWQYGADAYEIVADGAEVIRIVVDDVEVHKPSITVFVIV